MRHKEKRKNWEPRDHVRSSVSVGVDVAAAGQARRSVRTAPAGTATAEECLRDGECVTQRPLDAPSPPVAFRYGIRARERRMHGLLQLPGTRCGRQRAGRCFSEDREADGAVRMLMRPHIGVGCIMQDGWPTRRQVHSWFAAVVGRMPRIKDCHTESRGRCRQVAPGGTGGDGGIGVFHGGTRFSPTRTLREYGARPRSSPTSMPDLREDKVRSHDAVPDSRVRVRIRSEECRASGMIRAGAAIGRSLAGRRGCRLFNERLLPKTSTRSRRTRSIQPGRRARDLSARMGAGCRVSSRFPHYMVFSARRVLSTISGRLFVHRTIGGPRCFVYVGTSLRNEYFRRGIVLFIVILLQSITLSVWCSSGFYRVSLPP